MSATDCGCSKAAAQPRWITGFAETPAGKVPRISTTLDSADLWGGRKARWGIGRMNYRVTPGLYAVGQPACDSPVLAAANYKLSFDFLRRELTGLNVWVLVLDTKGINVWCAAGKGTFGTAELVRQLEQSGLARIVTHRRIILPQLGAPGVAGHEVARLSGFKVVYGPVRAADLPAFLQAGLKADPEMREVRFPFWDRLVLTPVEFVHSLKYLAIAFAVLGVLNILRPGPMWLSGLIVKTLSDFVPYLGAVLAGTILVPALLPWLPGRAFTVKGWFVGFVWALACAWWTVSNAGSGLAGLGAGAGHSGAGLAGAGHSGAGFAGASAGTGIPALAKGLSLLPPDVLTLAAANLLILPAITGLLAFNFTGSSTYTSLSGVQKELRTTFPFTVGAAGLGIILIIIGKILLFCGK